MFTREDGKKLWLQLAGFILIGAVTILGTSMKTFKDNVAEGHQAYEKIQAIEIRQDTLEKSFIREASQNSLFKQGACKDIDAIKKDVQDVKEGVNRIEVILMTGQYKKSK